MAIYTLPSNTYGTIRAALDEVGCDMMIYSGPPLTGPITDIGLYYWAMQAGFNTESGSSAGGGHFGIQVIDNLEGIPKRTVVNWGVYDDTPGHPDFAVFRGTTPIGNGFAEIGIDTTESHYFDWNYGEWLRFRIFKSPKQDWTSTDLTVGSGQVAPYIGTNQQPLETAFRCTIQNVSRNAVPVVYRDVLVRNARLLKPMNAGIFFTEPIGAPSQETWPYNPEMRYRNVNIDGYRTAYAYSVNYQDGVRNAGVYMAPGGEYIAHKGYETAQGYQLSPRRGRTLGGVPVPLADLGQILQPGSLFWDAPPANVTPAPLAGPPTPTATPRPWY